MNQNPPADYDKGHAHKLLRSVNNYVLIESSNAKVSGIERQIITRTKKALYHKKAYTQ